MVYDLLFKAAAETLTTIAADPKHLGARIGITAVLHTWGSALTHHPHIHMIVPGGGLSPDGSRWVSSRPAFLLPVRVLGKPQPGADSRHGTRQHGDPDSDFFSGWRRQERHWVLKGSNIPLMADGVAL